METRKPDGKVLESLLAEAQEHLRKVLGMLGVMPPTVPEFDALLDREGQLHHLIKQLEVQIASGRRN